MKKSFLKRVTAAIVAVPVALTQTALCTSFAAGETTDATANNTLGIKSVLDISTNTAALIPASEFKPAYDSQFNPFELTQKYAFVQESKWNEKVKNVLNSRDGETYNVSGKKLADSIENDDRAYQVIKAALSDPSTKAVAAITDQGVTVNANIDFDYVTELKRHAEEMLKNVGTDLTIQTDNLDKIANLKGTITMTVNAKDLDSKKIVAEVTAVINGEKQQNVKAVEATIDALQEEVLAALRQDIKASAQASGIDAEEALKAADWEKIAYDDYKKKFDRTDDSVEWKTYRPQADFDAALSELHKKWEKAPESLSALEQDKWFARGDKILKALLDQINDQDNGRLIDISMGGIVEQAKKAYNIEAALTADASKYISNGETLFYVKDEDADMNAYKKFFEEKYATALAEEGKQINEVHSVKVVEGQSVTDGENGISASATMDIYRIVYFDTKEISATTTAAETTTGNGGTSTAAETTTGNGGTSTAAETTTGEGTTTDTTPSKPTHVEGEIDMNVKLVDTPSAGGEFFFSHDSRAFDPKKMLAEGAVSNESDETIDYNEFTLGAYGATLEGIKDYGKKFSPAELYEMGTTDEVKFVAAELTLMYKGEVVVTGRERDAETGEITKAGTPVRVKVYVGVKGDLNLDGECNSKDSVIALRHASQVGSLGYAKATKISEFDDRMKSLIPANEALAPDFENFVVFLGDCDTETVSNEYTVDAEGNYEPNGASIGAKDAALILRYAARVGAKGSAPTFWVADAGVPVTNWKGEPVDRTGAPVTDADAQAKSEASLLDNPPAYSKEIAVGTGMLKSED